MKLICWNMAGAIGYNRERHSRAWEWLAAQEPDVALLQEAVIADGVPDFFGSVVFDAKYEKRWGSAVVTRSAGYRLREPLNDEPWLRHLRGAACMAESETGDAPLLVSLHSNAAEYKTGELEQLPSLEGIALCDPGERRVWEIDLAVHDLQRTLSGQPFIAGGDLNSAMLMDEVHSTSEMARLLANMSAVGMIDLRPRHSPQERQTFFKPNRRPYQLDHVFADAATEARTTGWRVDRSPVESHALSDHAPIIVQIED